MGQARCFFQFSFLINLLNEITQFFALITTKLHEKLPHLFFLITVLLRSHHLILLNGQEFYSAFAHCLAQFPYPS